MFIKTFFLCVPISVVCTFRWPTKYYAGQPSAAGFHYHCMLVKMATATATGQVCLLRSVESQRWRLNASLNEAPSTMGLKLMDGSGAISMLGFMGSPAGRMASFLIKVAIIECKLLLENYKLFNTSLGFSHMQRLELNGSGFFHKLFVIKC